MRKKSFFDCFFLFLVCSHFVAILIILSIFSGNSEMSHHNCCVCSTNHTASLVGCTSLVNDSQHVPAGAATAATSNCLCHTFGNSNNSFVANERRLMRSLVILSVTSALSLGIYNNLVVFSRFFWGPWTYLILSGSALTSSLSVYYAKCCVVQWGSRRVILASHISILALVLVHFSQSILFFTVSILAFSCISGPFFLAQLDFVQSFTVRLVHLSNVVRRRQQEQHQKLLHLLLNSPSHIVGHALFVCLAWATSSSSSSSSTSNRLNLHSDHRNLPPSSLLRSGEFSLFIFYIFFMNFYKLFLFSTFFPF